MTSDTNLPPIIGVAEALFDYTAQESTCINLNQGDVLYVLDKHDSGWWEGINPTATDESNARGWFPSNFVKLIPTPAVLLSNDSQPNQAMYTSRIAPVSPTQAVAATAHLPRTATICKRERPQLILPYSNNSSPVAIHPPPNVLSSSSHDDFSNHLGLINSKLNVAATNYIQQEASSANINIGHDGSLNTSQTDPSTQLPPNWRTRNTPDGKVYYYNTVSNETCWSLPSETAPPSNSLEPTILTKSVSNVISHSSSSLMMDPFNINHPVTTEVNTPSHELIAASNDQGLVMPTWEKLIGTILNTISCLNMSAKADDKPKYVPQTQAIVQAVHNLLLASDTTSKSSQVLQSNVQLKSFHHQLLSSVAKLMLSARVASGIWPPPDATKKMRHVAGQILLAIRHFVSVAQTDPSIQLVPIDTHSQSAYDDFAVSSTHMTDSALVAKIDKEGGSIATHLANILATLAADMSVVSSVTAEVITSARDAVINVGQLLSLFEDFNIVVRPDDTNLSILVTEFRAKCDLLCTHVNDLVTSLRTCMDEFAPPNSKQFLLSSTAIVHKSVAEAITCAKLVLEERATFETIALHGTVTMIEENKRDSDLSILQRRAMSLNFLPIFKSVSSINLLGNGFHSNPPAANESSVNQSNSNMTTSNTSLKPSHIGDVPPHECDTVPPMDPPPQASTEKVNPPSMQRLAANEDDRPTARRVTADFRMRTALSNSSSSSSLDSSKLTKFFGTDNAAITKSTSATHVRMRRKWFLEYDYDHSDITFNMEGQVTGGTLPALVERLTLHDTTIDTSFLQAFLLTFRCFAQPKEFLRQLHARFTLQPHAELNSEELDEWTTKKLNVIRLRVFNVLKLWLDNYYIDAHDDSILTEIQALATTVMEPIMPGPAKRIIDLVTRRIATVTLDTPTSNRGPKSFRQRTASATVEVSRSMPNSQLNLILPTPILPRSFPVKSFMDIDPLEMARQLTLCECQLLTNIHPSELLNQDFSKKDLPVALHVKEMVKFSTQLSSWTAESILSDSDPKKRCTVVKYWVKVAEKTFELHNFSSLRSIIGALDSSTIARLQRTWVLLSDKYKVILERLRKVTDHARNYAEYRAVLKSTVPPCVPFLGMYLTDLTFIHDGNPEKRGGQNQLINFDKYFKTAKVILELVRFQVPVSLKVVSEIQDVIHERMHQSITNGNMDALYRMSLTIEPRTPSTIGPPPASYD